MRGYRIKQPNLKSFMATYKKMYPYKYFLLNEIEGDYLILMDISYWTYEMIYEKSEKHLRYSNLYVSKKWC